MRGLLPDLNSTGNVFGSGFRVNATIGRAIRLGVLNAFGLAAPAVVLSPEHARLFGAAGWADPLRD